MPQTFSKKEKLITLTAKLIVSAPTMKCLSVEQTCWHRQTHLVKTLFQVHSYWKLANSCIFIWILIKSDLLLQLSYFQSDWFVLK